MSGRRNVGVRGVGSCGGGQTDSHAQNSGWEFRENG